MKKKLEFAPVPETDTFEAQIKPGIQESENFVASQYGIVIWFNLNNYIQIETNGAVFFTLGVKGPLKTRAEMEKLACNAVMAVFGSLA